MSQKLEVSFNSPQCGWMAVGFEDGENRFRTTTAHAPYSGVLIKLLNTLVAMIEAGDQNYSRTLQWNRDPEEFDFIFTRQGDTASIEIIEYPTGKRDPLKSRSVFVFKGDPVQIADAFYQTFRQLYEERDIDEFEQNWLQEFPIKELRQLSDAIGK